LDAKPTVLRYYEGWTVGFSKEGVKKFRPSELDPSIYPDGTWALIDPKFSIPSDIRGAPSGLIDHPDFFPVFTTSLEPSRWRDWQRQRTAAICVMQPWSWQEYELSAYDHLPTEVSEFWKALIVELCSRFNVISDVTIPYTEEVASRLYERYGPVPRNYKDMAGSDVDSRMKDYDDKLRYAIARLNFTKLDNLSRAHESTHGDISDFSLLMQLQPAFDRRPGFVYSVITSYVQEILFDSFIVPKWHEFYGKLRVEAEIHARRARVSSFPEFGSPLGWLWSGYCHSKIPTMAQLDGVIDLEATCEAFKNVSFDGMPKNVIRVKGAMALDSEQVGYHKPAVPDQAAFDAYSVTEDGVVVTFQYTSDYASEFGRLNDIFVKLGKNRGGGRDTERPDMWHHVLVVPDMEFSEGVKFVDKVKAVKLQDPGGCSFRQYVLSLKVERPTK
jgi:hypothetical protein